MQVAARFRQCSLDPGQQGPSAAERKPGVRICLIVSALIIASLHNLILVHVKAYNNLLPKL